MGKRKQFDRPQVVTADGSASQVIRDPERIATGYKRVYTVVSVRARTIATTVLRYGTGGEDNPKWHEEEPNPADDVVYHTEREYHCRQQDKGLVEVVNGSAGTSITVVWHGYDIKYEEG